MCFISVLNLLRLLQGKAHDKACPSNAGEKGLPPPNTSTYHEQLLLLLLRLQCHIYVRIITINILTTWLCQVHKMAHEISSASTQILEIQNSFQKRWHVMTPQHIQPANQPTSHVWYGSWCTLEHFLFSILLRQINKFFVVNAFRFLYEDYYSSSTYMHGICMLMCACLYVGFCVLFYNLIVDLIQLIRFNEILNSPTVSRTDGGSLVGSGIYLMAYLMQNMYHFIVVVVVAVVIIIICHIEQKIYKNCLNPCILQSLF